MTAVQQGGTQAGIDEYNRKGKDDTVKLRDSLNSMTNITKEKPRPLMRLPLNQAAAL